MKSILQYIIEKTSQKSDLSILKKYFKNFIKSNYKGIENTFGKSTGKEYEIARLECDKDIILDFVNAFNNSNEQKIIVPDIENQPKIYGTTLASSKYMSYELIYNGTSYYITDTLSANEKSLLPAKFFTPNKLNIAQETPYNNYDEFYNKVYNSIIENKKLAKYKNIKNFVLNVIDGIDKFKNVKKDGIFNINTSEDFFNNTDDGNIVIDTEIPVDKSILPGDISNIENDFGEILGPLVLLKLFDDVNVSFPIASNEPLVDYYINGYAVSAKNLKNGGASPSGVSVMQRYLNINKESETLDKVANKLNDNTNKENNIITNGERDENEFIKYIAKSYEYKTVQQQYSLIKHFILDDKHSIIKNFEFADIIDKLFSEENPNAFSTEKFADNVRTIFKSENQIKEFFKSFYELLNYKAKLYKVDYVTKNLLKYKSTSKNNNIIWGIFGYPLYVRTVNIMNDLYATGENNALSDIINKVVDMKQIYLGFVKNNNTNYLKIKIVATTANDWVFVTGGISTNDMTNSKLAIKLKEK